MRQVKILVRKIGSHLLLLIFRYYYSRVPWKMLKMDPKTNQTIMHNGRGKMPISELKMSFDDCVETQHRQEDNSQTLLN